MPTILGLMKGIIIQILVLGDFSLQGNVLTDIEAGAVQKQRCQQPAHSAIPIVKGMDTEKIVDKDRNICVN